MTNGRRSSGRRPFVVFGCVRAGAMMTAPSEEPEMSDTYRIVRSTVTDDGTVRIAIDTEPMPEPGPDEVVVAVEAAPINPSDLGMLIAGADPESFALVDGARFGTVCPAAMAMNAARVGQPMPCGNEGAGTVVAAGSSPVAQAMLGATISGVSGSMFASHTKLSHVMCIPVPGGIAAAAASSFVNRSRHSA